MASIVFFHGHRPRMPCAQSNEGIHSLILSQNVRINPWWGLGFKMNDLDYHHVSPTIEFGACISLEGKEDI